MTALRSLVRSRGWALLDKIGDEQVRNREVHLANMDVGSLETMAERNVLKGEKDGVKLFLSFPQLLIDAAEEVVKENEVETDE